MGLVVTESFHVNRECVRNGSCHAHDFRHADLREQTEGKRFGMQARWGDEVGAQDGDPDGRPMLDPRMREDLIVGKAREVYGDVGERHKCSTIAFCHVKLANAGKTHVGSNNLPCKRANGDNEVEAAQTFKHSTTERHGFPKHLLKPCWCIKQEREGEAANPGPEGEHEETEISTTKQKIVFRHYNVTHMEKTGTICLHKKPMC